MVSSVTAEDSDRQCELEAIQKELGDLLVKKKELKKQENRFKFGNGAQCGYITQRYCLMVLQCDTEIHFCTCHILGQPIVHCNFRKTPRSRVYLLPHLHQEDLTLQTVKTRIDAEILTGPVVSGKLHLTHLHTPVSSYRVIIV